MRLLKRDMTLGFSSACLSISFHRKLATGESRNLSFPLSGKSTESIHWVRVRKRTGPIVKGFSLSMPTVQAGK